MGVALDLDLILDSHDDALEPLPLAQPDPELDLPAAAGEDVKVHRCDSVIRHPQPRARAKLPISRTKK